MQQLPLLDIVRRPAVVHVAPGAVWLRAWLNPGQQRVILAESLAMLDGPAGGYVPKVRGGGTMHVRMMCLGRHWNARTYQYVSTRADYDHRPVAPVPLHWQDLAQDFAHEAGFAFSPDICIINWYDEGGRMGLHQDKGESVASLASGAPVVSLSIGDTSRFLLGGLSRGDAPDVMMLDSGDVFVFGGPARLRFHGVTRILAGTAPSPLAVRGRLNLTFRQY